MDDLYQILGVFRDSTQQQIRSRYLALRITYETRPGLPTEWFDEIKRAYHTLSNPVQRQISDSLDNIDLGDLNFMEGIEEDPLFRTAVGLMFNPTERFL